MGTRLSLVLDSVFNLKRFLNMPAVVQDRQKDNKGLHEGWGKGKKCRTGTVTTSLEGTDPIGRKSGETSTESGNTISSAGSSTVFRDGGSTAASSGGSTLTATNFVISAPTTSSLTAASTTHTSTAAPITTSSIAASTVTTTLTSTTTCASKLVIMCGSCTCRKM